MSKFLYLPIHIIIPLHSLHFSPFLPTFIHPPIPLWKMWKIMWKTFSLAYKYPINQRKIPINAQNRIRIPYLFFYFLFVRYFIWLLLRILICFRSVVPLIYWEPMVPRPSFPEKTFSLFSSSPHFVRVAVKPFFIYRT